MNILLVAATQKELDPFLKKANQTEALSFIHVGKNIDVLITGIGMLATSYHLTQKLVANSYDLVLNIGICGAFDRTLELGEVIGVSSDLPIEEGAEDGVKWIDLQTMGLRSANEFPYENGVLSAKINNRIADQLEYKMVKSISVNRVLGNDESIQKMKAYYTADIESMEGAAIYFCCIMQNVNCLQLRAISNYVENRNKEEWKIDMALANLAEATLKFIEHV